MGKKVIPKKRRGRPATGRDPLVALRLPAAYVAWIDETAKANHCSRSVFLRALLDEGEKTLRQKWRRKERRELKARAKNAALVEAVLAGVHDDEPKSASVVVSRRRALGFRRPLTPDDIKAAA